MATEKPLPFAETEAPPTSQALPQARKAALDFEYFTSPEKEDYQFGKWDPDKQAKYLEASLEGETTPESRPWLWAGLLEPPSNVDSQAWIEQKKKFYGELAASASETARVLRLLSDKIKAAEQVLVKAKADNLVSTKPTTLESKRIYLQELVDAALSVVEKRISELRVTGNYNDELAILEQQQGELLIQKNNFKMERLDDKKWRLPWFLTAIKNQARDLRSSRIDFFNGEKTVPKMAPRKLLLLAKIWEVEADKALFLLDEAGEMALTAFKENSDEDVKKSIFKLRKQRSKFLAQLDEVESIILALLDQIPPERKTKPARPSVINNNKGRLPSSKGVFQAG